VTIEIDPDKVETLASQGLTMDQISSCLGCCTATLYNKMGSEVEVLDAIKRGRAKGVATIANALFETGKAGNVTAQIFYLKNRSPEDWKDRKETELTGKGGGPLEISYPIQGVTPKPRPDGNE
jgi:hypothetical protein